MKVVQGTLQQISESGEVLWTDDPSSPTRHQKGDSKPHKTSNTSSSKSISLHLYSPPYLECNFSRATPEGNVGHFVPVIYCSNSDGVWTPKETRNRLLSLGNPADRISNDLDSLNVSDYLESQCFMNLQTLLEILRVELNKPYDIPYMTNLLSKVQLNPKEWEQYTRFETTKYTRNLVGYDESFTLLLLCWSPKQASPIHDHAGSSCWVKILAGDLREIRYDVTDPTTPPKEIANVIAKADAVTYMDDTIGCHIIENPSMTEGAVSLHIYCPPYTQCHVYDKSLEVVEGKRKALMTCASSGATSPFLQQNISLKTRCKHFASLNYFVNYLRNQFKQGNEIDSMTNLMDYVCFQPREWEKYIHFDQDRYTRNLIALDDNFSLILICWHGGQKTPIHTGHNNAKTIVKVIQGEVTETLYQHHFGEFLPIETRSFKPTSPAFFQPAAFGTHSIGNASPTELAVSLHLYSPPYTECEFQLDGIPKKLPVVYYSDGADTHLTHDLKALEGQFMAQKKVYSDFHSLVDVLVNYFKLLKEELEKKGPVDLVKPDPSKIYRILKNVELNPKEWKNYISPDPEKGTSSHVAHNAHFSIFVVIWKSNESTTIHDHGGSQSWLKVLEGELEEIGYDSDLSLSSMNTLVVGSVSHTNGTRIHKIANKDRLSVSLHLHCPAYTKYHSYTKSGTRHSISDDLLGIFGETPSVDSPTSSSPKSQRH